VRRCIALLLLVPTLTLSLCAAHECGGGNCEICAMLRAYRAMYAAGQQTVTARVLSARAAEEERVFASPTLVSERVELRD